MNARLRTATRLGAMLLSVCALFPPGVSAQSICAAAKIELGQEAALEREGFTATLSMTNNLADQALTGVRIELIVKNEQGNASESLFFANVTSLEGTSAIDGTGTIQPSGTAKTRWLIIPSPGAGGTGASGVRYTVQARMSMLTSGVPRVITTFPVAITVKPQPLLTLEYALPFEVFGDEPLTTVHESTVPFPLGLRVTNVGAGTAKKFKVTSNQPLITDNAQGLAVDFNLIGTWLGSDAQAENTLLLAFGDVAPGTSKQAAWSMTSTLSGRFVNFTSTFTHAAELGGALTSLIQSVTTYTLIKDVLVDLPGRDAQFDFLVNATTPRSQMELDYQIGREPKPEFLMESDRPGLTPVVDAAAQLTGSLSGAGSVLHLAYLVPVASNTWVHAAVAAPNGGSAPLLSVTRADGKVVSPRNAWISKHFDKTTLSYSYFLHVLDYTGPAASDYAMAFNASSLDVPPSAVADLAAAPSGHGALDLSWTATGEDGVSGAIFGGRYAVFATTDSFVAPSVPAALVNFATSTTPGATQQYRLSGLQGNATYFVTVYLADAAGQYSPASNRAAARTGAHSPQNAAALVGETTLAVSWNNAANVPDAAYRLTLSTAGGTAAQTGYLVDASSHEFTGLVADTTYFVTAQARNADLFESSSTVIATAVTLATPPSAIADGVLSVSSDAATVQWAGTAARYRVRASATSGGAALATLTVAGSTSATVPGLLPDASYYFSVAAVNAAGVETSTIPAASTVTLAALLPPVVVSTGPASVQVSWTTGAASGYRLEASTIGFGAGEPLAFSTASTNGSTPLLALTGLSPSTTYFLRAAAINRVGAVAYTALGSIQTSSAVVPSPDTVPPVVTLAFSTPSFTSSGGVVTIGTQALVSLFAVDPSSTVPASGVAQILYAVDSTTPAFVYTTAFTLALGTHTVYFSATDLAGNASAVSSAALAAAASPFVGAFSPSSGPIGIGYSMQGFGFGVYAGANTGVKFGISTTPVSVWNDASIVGTVPGLSTGAYAVTVERLSGSTLTVASAGTFTVTPLVPTLSISSGPIGLPFTLTGPGFGTYLGANTRVLFAGTTAPISVWNDATISGTIPGVSAGTTTVVVQRLTTDGGLSQSEPLPFTVTVPSITAVVPSSSPIGMAFTLTGWSFGNYAGTNTQVLFEGTTAPISVWNDHTIVGTVPGSLAPGAHSLLVERRTADGGVSRSSPAAYTVEGLALTAINPSTGAIGIPFTLTGTGFGAYGGANTRVKFGVSTAAISVWNDGSITGTIPTLATGAYAVSAERQQGADVSVSNLSTFTVIAPSIASVAPSSGPIGTVFTVTGAGFGPYAGANTFLLLGGSTTPISVWNDTTITATVPGLLTQGVKELVAVRRNTDGGLTTSNTAYFEVTGISIASIAPSTGAIGIPFTISGSQFGAYDGANTRVRFGVSTAAVSVWNNTTIAGTIPTLATGAYAVTVERQQGTDVSVSNASTFTVIGLEIASVAPSSGPIGTAFTLTGAGFGPYAGANTYLLLGGTTTPVSVWNDTTITATVPGGLTTGVKELTAVRRNADGGLSVSNTAYFEVTGMSVVSLTPSTGPIGVPFTITGTQFGTYLGANTRVRFGVSTAAVSVWNNTTISGTVPSLASGTYTVVLERQQGADVALSNYSSFTVTALAFSGPTPSSGPIGVAFTISGSGFGPYAGTNTRLLLGGTTVAVSVWNDATITGTVPNLAAGNQPLWIERLTGGGVQSSATSYFQVTTPAVATLVPSSAPIGAPFAITGSNFGPYAGANTRVTFNGVVAPVSVWNDHNISGTVPGSVSTGPAVLVVERAAGAGLSQSTTQAFEVLLPVISTVSPSFGPAGTVVTLTGHGFGPYAGTATKLLVGGSTVAVSVWNDSTIRWTVSAGLSNGNYALVVRRAPSGGTVDSDSATFTVGTGYGGASFGFAAPLALAALPDTHFEGDLNLPVVEGGRVETPSKAAVEVPPNALDQDTEITLKRLHKDGLRTEAAETVKKRAAGEAIEFGPEGTQFNTPVTIELPYDPALTADETKLAVHYYDTLRRVWEELPSVVDRTRHVVKAQTAHFSIYQPMGLAPTTVAQDEFYFRDQYAFPNPSRGNAAVTFRIQPGLADTIELRVYDLSGRKIHDSTDFTFRGAFDDGNGKGAQNTYDHAWDVSGVGSGVYTYVIKASRAGQTPIVKSGKAGVIK